MKLLNFGSLNYDYVYSVDRILIPGETRAAERMETFCGGKGLNQSIALARAGAAVCHAGYVGEDGGALVRTLRENGVDTSFVKTLKGKSGHTVIQVDRNGQNCILLYGGANRRMEERDAARVFSAFGPGDLVLLQNEINGTAKLIEMAARRGMRVVYNPSPCDDAALRCDFSRVALLFINEVEGGGITGETRAEKILDVLRTRFPKTAAVLTLGEAGAFYQDARRRVWHGIYPLPAVDTTAAGDTFTGYFLAATAAGQSVERALELASRAAAVAVSRKGAAPSIPTMEEVLRYPFPPERRAKPEE